MALIPLLFVAMMAAVAAPALGVDYVVGDEAGWKLNVNYTAWAQGKEFHVGDRLSKPLFLLNLFVYTYIYDICIYTWDRQSQM